MRLTLLLILGFCSGPAAAQLFTEVSSDLGINYSYNGGNYGGGVSFYDADHNGWDDMTFCTNGDGVIIYQNFNGVFSPPINVVSGPGQVKQAIWIDYDNDGDSDLFVTRHFGKWSLHQNTGSILELIDVTVSAGLDIADFPQGGGSCWADIDNDGFLDVYIPNYDYVEGSPKNFLYHNNGDGTFSDVSEISGADDGNKASFQGLFFDYDQNGTQDLFVINDRLPFTNSFFKNDGNGIFNNTTAFAGLEQYIFSMNASISDINHDGEYELYITNNPTGNYLFSFNPQIQQFHDISSSSGTQVFDHSWAGNWLDADNDTWEDLYVAVSPFWGQPGQDQFFFNNGDGTFTMDIASTGFDGDATFSHSTAIGDFNNDGFSDLVVVNKAPQPSNVFRNNGNNNHYLKVALEGVNCNIDAFGARIEVYLGDELLIRTVHGGECYMTQNSKTEIFGLGAAEMVDSLSVIWPGGFTETAYNISVDQKIKIVEGEITEINAQVLGNIDYTNLNLCLTDSILLFASNTEPVLWNNSVFADSIWVASPGEYTFSYSIFNTPYSSETVTVIGTNDFNLDINVTNLLCYGQQSGAISIDVLGTEAIESYTLNGALNAELENLTAGTYELTVLSENGCEVFETIEVTEPEELLTEYEVTQSECFGEVTTVSVSISGGTPSYATFWQGFNPNDANAGTFFPYVTDANGCEASGTVTIDPVLEVVVSLSSQPSVNGDDGQISLEIEGGTGDYTFQWSGPDGFTSDAQNLFDLSPGFYTIVAQDSNGCIVSDSILVTAVSVLELVDFECLIYPQPAEDVVFIESLLPLTQIDLYDLQGRKVLTAASFSSKTKLEVNHLTAGTYLLVLQSNSSFSQRILILK